MIQLHKHQRGPVNTTLKLWRTNRRLIGRAPTGSGKTIIGCAVAAKRGSRTLILVHTRKLMHQWAETINAHFPELQPVGMIGDGRYQPAYKTTVAIAPSIAEESKLRELVSRGRVGTIIADEAHRSVVGQQQFVIEWLLQVNREARVLGLSASPFRSDGVPMDVMYDKVAFDIPLLDLVRKGMLARPTIKLYRLDYRLDGVPVINGDYAPADVARVMDVPLVRDAAVQAWMKDAYGRKTILFAKTIEQAEHMAVRFRAYGINAATVTGDTPERDREYYEQYLIVCNVGVYVEGADIPGVSCVMNLAPTMNQSRWLQMMGRAMRPDTPDAIGLDFWPHGSHNLVDGREIMGHGIPFTLSRRREPRRSIGEWIGLKVGAITGSFEATWED